MRLGACSTFTLQQEVSPEGDDQDLFAQPVLLLGEVEGEELVDGLARQAHRRRAEDAGEDCRAELHLGGAKS